MKFGIQKRQNSYAIYIKMSEKKLTLAWAYVYVLTNDLHKEPFGLLENVYVNEKYRGKGLGKKLVRKAIAEAKKAGCYKLICTSRNEKIKVHKFYQELGFSKFGFEFRMDF